MGKLKITVFGLLAVALFAAFTITVEPLKIGAQAPMTDQEVEDISGKTLTLEGVAKENGLLVMFSCNTCPWVAKWEDRYNVLAGMAEQNKIGMIALNPNERIRDKGESMEDMQKRAEKQGYDFYYALDKDHILADAFGATRTPEIFLFNKDMKLVYHGAIDDNANDASSVESSYAIDAIEEMVAGEDIATEETKSLGCTIKRTE